MNIEDLAQLLLSQQAVLIYEIIIFVIMAVTIVVLNKKRNIRRQIQSSSRER